MSDLGVEMLAAAAGFDSSNKLFFEKIAAVLSFIPRINGYANQLFDDEHLVHPLAIKKSNKSKALLLKKNSTVSSHSPKYIGAQMVPMVPPMIICCRKKS